MLEVVILLLCIIVSLLFVNSRKLRKRCIELEGELQEIKNSQEKNKELNNEKSKTDLENVSITNVCSAMSKSGSLPIIDHISERKTYKNCFIGYHAVSWLARKMDISRTEATKLCQEMLDKKYIKHIEDNDIFEDRTDRYYTFITDHSSSFEELGKLSGELKLGLIDEQMEGYLEIFTLAFWHTNYFVQRHKKLLIFNKPKWDGGVKIGEISLQGCQITDLKASHFSFQICNVKDEENIFSFINDPNLPVSYFL